MVDCVQFQALQLTSGFKCFTSVQGFTG